MYGRIPAAIDLRRSHSYSNREWTATAGNQPKWKIPHPGRRDTAEYRRVAMSTERQYHTEPITHDTEKSPFIIRRPQHAPPRAAKRNILTLLASNYVKIKE